MGLFNRSRRPAAEQVLADFMTEHSLVAPTVEHVDELLPHSIQVADAHQLRHWTSDFTWRWWGGTGTLPGGVLGTIARVEIWDREQHNDTFDTVRLPAPAATLLPTVEVKGPTFSDLRAYDGHRMSDIPFRPGESQKAELDGVGRRYKARVPRGADPTTVASVLHSEFVSWLAAAGPPFCFELFDGWISVFRLDRSTGNRTDETFYPGLCDAAARFAAACVERT
jgi:hypothetical protein